MEQHIAKFSAMERDHDIVGMTDTLIRVTERVAGIRSIYQPDFPLPTFAEIRRVVQDEWDEDMDKIDPDNASPTAGPKRMRPESAEADPELTVSYVVEPERRMSELSVDRPQSAVTTGRRSARGNWHNRLRIGIMGGTFDPIHNGHLVAASEVSWVYDLDEVIFVPTGRPVFKLDKKVTNAEDRYLMTVIATASNPKFTVSRVDIDRPGVTYTIA